MSKKVIEQNIALKSVSGIPRTPLAFVMHISKPHKRWALFSISTVVVAQTLGVVGYYIIAQLIDHFTLAQTMEAQLEVLLYWGLGFFALTIAERLAWRASGFLGIKWLVDMHATGYRILYRYLTNHSHTYFTNRFAGSLSSKVSHAVDGGTQLAERFLWGWLQEIVSLTAAIVLFWTVHWSIAVLVMTVVVILFVFNVWFVRRRRPHVVAYSQASSKVRGEGVDLITNIGAVRQYARRGEELARLDETIADRADKDKLQWYMGERLMVVNTIVGILLTGFVLLFMYDLFAAGMATAGTVVLVLSLLGRIGFIFAILGNMLNGFIRIYGECEEGLEDVLRPHEIVDVPEAKELKTNGGEIRWGNVTFTFDKNTVFDSFDLTIKPGQRVGLVGASGAGKTTFVSLLLRQHDINSGEILIDGQNIAKVTQDSLRESIAVVPQEPMLFHRSISENIAYGKPDATKSEIRAAAAKAQALEFVLDLPDKFDTLVGERGVKLSGGQKQRVAIARAMLKDAPILLLDEATSALDSESEVEIQKALHVLMAGKTVIAVAHRLSTLREMDRIIVLDKGKIVEDGSHEALVAYGGVYAKLWEHQAGGFLQD